MMLVALIILTGIYSLLMWWTFDKEKRDKRKKDEVIQLLRETEQREAGRRGENAIH